MIHLDAKQMLSLILLGAMLVCYQLGSLIGFSVVVAAISIGFFIHEGARRSRPKPYEQRGIVEVTQTDIASIEALRDLLLDKYKHNPTSKAITECTELINRMHTALEDGDEGEAFFYCQEWGRCGFMCEQQCDGCAKQDNN